MRSTNNVNVNVINSVLLVLQFVALNRFVVLRFILIVKDNRIVAASPRHRNGVHTNSTPHPTLTACPPFCKGSTHELSHPWETYDRFVSYSTYCGYCTKSLVIAHRKFGKNS